jgi:lambda family phage portal protein
MADKPRYRVKAPSVRPVPGATEARPRAHALGENTGFEAGRTARRLKGFVPSGLHVNQLVQQAGSTILKRARHLVRNSGYARKAVSIWASSVVGAGITPKSAIKAEKQRAGVQDLWLEWTDEADSESLTDFYGLLRRIAREEFIAGECFVRIRDRRSSDGLSVPMQLQVLPAEMLPLAKNEDLGGGRVIRHGIEFDPIGRRVAYHFLRRHPGDPQPSALFGATETVAVPAEQVVHVFDPIDAGQIRGVSRLTSAIIKLFMLDQYDDAELSRKNVAALYAGFVTTPEDGGDPLEDDEDEDGLLPLEPGILQKLRPGEDIRFSSPSEVGGSYEAFQYRTLLQIAAATGIPYAYLTGDMTQANYSSVRTALVEFRRDVEAFQHSVMIFLCCRPIWRAWLDRAVLSGAVALRDYERKVREYRKVEWLPPHWDWVDPLKDVQAEIAQIRAGLKSRAQSVAERGYDVIALDEEIAADKARADRLGLVFDTDAKSTSSAGVTQARPGGSGFVDPEDAPETPQPAAQPGGAPGPAVPPAE